jgi:hypothetical protein
MDHNSELMDALQFAHGLLRDQMCSVARPRTQSNVCILSRTQHLARIREHWANLYGSDSCGHLRTDKKGAVAPTAKSA